MVSYTPRYYQQDAHNKAIAYIKKNTAPCLLELATGAGKSIIVSMLAQTLSKLAPHKKILCIAPSSELVEQNAEKYRATGSACSIYCASLNSKCMREQVIFASPLSIKKEAKRVAHIGVAAIIIDEAHGITATIKSLIDEIISYELDGKKINEHCRIIGMTATPYRTGEGYIYAVDATSEQDKVIDLSQAKKPYFHKLIYKITTEQLIEQEFLTPVVTDSNHDTYDTSTLEIDKGKFTADSVRLTFENNETKTALIVNEVISKARTRQGGIIFASTIAHAKNILAMLRSAGQSAEIVTGESEFKAARPRAIQLFKMRAIKFLVNVDVLTTGFDAPHIDLVVIMRATESAGLLQQMIGRGLRLSQGKKDCLLLDYAENIERHSLQLNLFEPEIRAKADTKKGEPITFRCPSCNMMLAATRRNDSEFDDLQHDEFGYFILDDGSRMMRYIDDNSKVDEFGNAEKIELPMPAHYMRRCPNPEAYKSMGKPYPCEHRFSLKTCKHCGAENDIAARQCCSCKEPLIDVNEKLTLEASKVVDAKADFIPCHGMSALPYTSKASGNKSIRFTFNTDAGAIVAYVTKKIHWLLNPIARANNINPENIPDDYSNAYAFTRAPTKIKIKKEDGKISVKKVSYESDLL